MPTSENANDEAEDVLLLAKLIGIGSDEPEYFWIAKEAYNSDLPGGWEIFFDNDGKPFYFEARTKTTTYEHPSINFFRVLYKDLKKKDEDESVRQKEQELLFSQPDETQSKNVPTDPTKTSENANIESIEQNTKAKLLLAFSDDPSLAARYSEEIKEHESRVNEILKAAIRKEEEAFMKRLKLFTSSKHTDIVRPLEQRIKEYSEIQSARLEDALQKMTHMLQAQISGQPQPQLAKRGAGHPAVRSPFAHEVTSSVNQTQRPNTEAAAGRELQRLQEENAALLEENSRLREEAAAAIATADALRAADKSVAREADLRTELDALSTHAMALEHENAMLRDELARRVAAPAAQEPADVAREMDRLSALARYLDSAPPATAAAGTATALTEGLLGVPTRAPVVASPTAPPGDALAEEATLLRALERMEMLGGDRDGPVARLQARVRDLEATVRMLEGERDKWAGRAAAAEEARADGLQARQVEQALGEELRRAKEHGEQMEFLAKQYSDQAAALHAALQAQRFQACQHSLAAVLEDYHKALMPHS